MEFHCSRTSGAAVKLVAVYLKRCSRAAAIDVADVSDPAKLRQRGFFRIPGLANEVSVAVPMVLLSSCRTNPNAAEGLAPGDVNECTFVAEGVLLAALAEGAKTLQALGLGAAASSK